MDAVTPDEFTERFEHWREVARREPVTVTREGRDDLVVLSAEEYERLRDGSEADDLAIMRAIERGVADIREDRTVPHDAAMRRLRATIARADGTDRVEER